MNAAAIKKFCLSLPNAKNEIKWGVDHVYTIGEKMFAVALANRDGKTVVSFKVDADLFLPMSDRPGFIPAPYLARAKWVQVIDVSKVGDAELKAMIRHSYDLVAAKLTKKLRAELGIA
jgi:predicted DNA-binding protein (MmcQ/YjbR family)